MNKNITIGGILITTAIILGAFGAHYLKETLKLPQEKLDSWGTGVHYQVYNGLGLILIGIISRMNSLNTKLPTVLITIGSLFFSISIYFLSLNYVWEIDAFKYIFGPMTPIGGLLMIIGWSLFTYRATKNNSSAAS